MNITLNKNNVRQITDKYFEECLGCPVLDDDGNKRLDKNGNVLRTASKAPTLSGLALALGFNSRQELFDFKCKNKNTMQEIIKAKTKVEEFAEGKLFESCSSGAKFNLMNNFDGWNDKPKDPQLSESIQKVDTLIKEFDNEAEQ